MFEPDTSSIDEVLEQAGQQLQQQQQQVQQEQQQQQAQKQQQKLTIAPINLENFACKFSKHFYCVNILK